MPSSTCARERQRLGGLVLLKRRRAAAAAADWRWRNCFPANGQLGVVSELAAEAAQMTDADAIERSLVEPEAFVAIFERHFTLVHRFVRSRGGDAEEVAAETFATAFRRRGDYDLGRADARAWLLGIAVNLMREARRTDRRRRAAYARVPREAPHEETTEVVRRLDAHVALSQIRGLLANLEPLERDLLLLHACVELTYAEIAEALGIPIGTVRSRIHRLRAKVQAATPETLSTRRGER
jgi:RNA polymerase sigma factor (sigma-70 family)